MMPGKAFFLSIVLMLATLLVVGALALSPEPVVVRTNLENLPLEIGGYLGTEDRFPESVYRELGADMHVYRHYRSADGSLLDLYIGYYGTAKGGRTSHNPYDCLPGSGWSIVDSRKVKIQPSSDASKVEVNYVKARRDGANIVMLHWYQTSADAVITSGLQQNIERFWGRILHNRNDGAYVQITTQVFDGQLADAEMKVQRFAGLVIPLIPEYWPMEN